MKEKLRKIRNQIDLDSKDVNRLIVVNDEATAPHLLPIHEHLKSLCLLMEEMSAKLDFVDKKPSNANSSQKVDEKTRADLWCPR